MRNHIFFTNYCSEFKNLLVLLQMQFDRRVPIAGTRWDAAYLFKSVYPTLVLGRFNWVCDGAFPVCNIIRREAPRCLFYPDGHMHEPQKAKQVTDTDSHTLFFTNANEEGPAAENV